MATRTSSPPGSRSGSTRGKKTARGSSTRSRSTGSTRKTAPKGRSSGSAPRAWSKRVAPRSVRTGRGPISRTFGVVWGGICAVWLGVAHAIGGTVRGLGRTARDLDPEHRRDGFGLALLGSALIVAAAVWWDVPGGLMDFVRTVIAGSVGKVAWLVPLMLVLVAWRNLRNPERNGPVGRQLIGWASIGFGVLGIVQIANGNPQPYGRQHRAACRTLAGAVGYVVASLLLDLLRTPYVVVPLLVLLTIFGTLVVTATPVYQIPEKLSALRDRLLGRTKAEGEPDTQPVSPRQATRVNTGGRTRHLRQRPGVRLARSCRPRSRPTPTASADRRHLGRHPPGCASQARGIHPTRSAAACRAAQAGRATRTLRGRHLHTARPRDPEARKHPSGQDTCLGRRRAAG